MLLKIDDIRSAKDQKTEVDFSEIIEEINPKIPVEARLCIKMYGNAINVTGKISAKAILSCDLCLKEFMYEVEAEIDENYVLGKLFDGKKGEIELSKSEFVEELVNTDGLDVTDLIYQSVILNTPNKSVCDINCKGEEKLAEYMKKETQDPRLEIFKKIKIEKED